MANAGIFVFLPVINITRIAVMEFVPDALQKGSFEHYPYRTNPFPCSNMNTKGSWHNNSEPQCTCFISDRHTLLIVIQQELTA